jgi:hypothetical protein
MTKSDSEPSVAATKRELDHATAALEEPGAGARANLECRVSDLQVRFVSTPARDLADIEARLQLIREMVTAIGSPGYLLNVVDATLEDIRAMRADNR